MDVMEDFPMLTRPNTPPEWDTDDSENPLPTTTSTPTSADLFPSPSSPVGSPGGLNTPKSDTFSEVLSSDTNSNGFDDGVQDTGVLTIDDTDLEAMTCEPTLEPERNNTVTAEGLASPGNTGRNVARACPSPGHYGVFYLVCLEHDRSFLFSTREAAEHTLQQISAKEDGDLIVTHGVVNCPDALLRDRTVKRFYYGVRGLDNHGVFCDASVVQLSIRRSYSRTCAL
ncbi:hypothetical protein EYR40_010940 [Pleurotus pulmonarius]|nr:hypothetical protein EYR36_002707 [Pleurotus pulmonarius]KAF4586923.1 hypothetical protein EYR40_010940 [Pleurotus pulmonarius]